MSSTNGKRNGTGSGLEQPGSARRLGAAKAQPSIITTHNVTYSFGSVAGVFDLTFAVPSGSIFGLIGPSGCGKTTTVRLLTGVYRPTKGLIRVMHQSPHTFTAGVRERIGYMPQQFALYPNLSVAENLLFFASLYGLGLFERRRRLRELLELVELTDARNRLGRQLSGGMQRRLELACALVNNPNLLFADEPTAGIDPVLRGKFWEHFRQLRNAGHTLVVTTQYINEAAYCDLVGVMRSGRLLYLDTPARLRLQALGGEMIKILVDEAHTLEAARLLSHMPLVQRVATPADAPGLIHVYVAKAGLAIPLLASGLSAHPAILLRYMEEYQPPFDDIFVRLIQQAEARSVEP